MSARNLSLSNGLIVYHHDCLILDATSENGDYQPALADGFALHFTVQPWLRHGERACPPKRAFALSDPIRHYTRHQPVQTQPGVMP